LAEDEQFCVGLEGDFVVVVEVAAVVDAAGYAFDYPAA
jgi:hypothetical protein